jgi:lysophospholipase L1-like esterase
MGDLLDEIDCAVFLIGINDLSKALSGDENRIRAGLPPRWRRSRWMESIAWLVRAHEARGTLEVEDEAGDVYSARRQRRQQAKLDSERPDLAVALAEFGGRVRRIVQIRTERGVRPVFLSQPVLWRDGLTADQEALLWFGRLENGSYLTTQALRESMDLYNGQLRRICAELDVEFVDLSSMSGIGEYFYDDCHFSEAGARRVAELVAAHFREHGPGPSRPGRAGETH